ncbi:hypothetical protein [Novosphingobium huizhouense]|uniref:hypothetical protein n=1 Tax=Novosphingobium huizhouense TaxID=2866625 RepID=UPI001CD90B1D|nr:hypothetical protein [Novosphingobium huizhouense]
MHDREPCEHCGKRTACPHYPAHAAGFLARVQLAARCLRTGTGIGSRAYDNCFEMFDGDAVVAMLDRWAERDPVLRAAIDAEWRCAAARQGWSRAVARFITVSEDRLPFAARQLRDAERDPAGTLQLGLAL